MAWAENECSARRVCAPPRNRAFAAAVGPARGTEGAEPRGWGEGGQWTSSWPRQGDPGWDITGEQKIAADRRQPFENVL